MELEPFSFYLSAWEEDRHTIAQANIELDEKLNIVQNIVDARRQGNFVLVNKADVDYVDVSPKQLVSVAASLVPFLEHDDANRALMGANMQRQSVPLLVAEAPLRRHRHGGRHRARLRRRHPRQAQRHRRFGRLRAHHRARRRRAPPHPALARGRLGHLSAHQVQALQPEHLHQPEAHRPPRRPRGQGPGHRRRPLHRAGRARPRPQRPGRLHALARLQLRGRHPDLRKTRPRGLLHLHPHRGVRDRSPRHQARAGRDHPRYPQRQRARAARPRRERHHPHRRQGRPQRHPRRQGHAQGRDPAHPGREAAARHLRREGRRRPRRIAHLPSGHRRHRRRRPHLLPQGSGEGRARQADRAGAGREAGAQPRR